MVKMAGKRIPWRVVYLHASVQISKLIYIIFLNRHRI